MSTTSGMGRRGAVSQGGAKAAAKQSSNPKAKRKKQSMTKPGVAPGTQGKVNAAIARMPANEREMVHALEEYERTRRRLLSATRQTTIDGAVAKAESVAAKFERVKREVRREANAKGDHPTIQRGVSVRTVSGGSPGLGKR